MNPNLETLVLLDNSLNFKKLKEILSTKKPVKIISFDYFTHKLLKENSIPHQISDNYLNNSDFEKLQKWSHNLSLWSLDSSFSKEFEYEGVNTAHLFYRDFQHSLLPIMKKFYEVLKIFQTIKYSSCITSSSLYDYVKIFLNDVEILSSEKNNSQKLLNQSIKYQFNFGSATFSLNFSRKNYRLIKNISEKIIHKLFGPKKNSANINVLLAEFDPIKFKELFQSSKNSNISLCLYNRRRPSIWNKTSYSVIKNSNSQILSPSMLDKTKLVKNTNNIFLSFKKNIEIILNKKEFFEDYFSIDGVSFWPLVKPVLKKFFANRLEEGINEIEIAKGIFEKIHLDSLIIQNESGFTEQIIINFAKNNNIPIFLISHGLSYETLDPKNYERRIFDGVDPIQSSKYLVWGKSQYLFAKNYGIEEEKLKIVGSPTHDLLFDKNMNNSNDEYVLLATSSPIASFSKHLTVEALEKYENGIKEICKVVTNNGKNLIIKLHPFQEELDVTNLVKEINTNIKIVKTGDIVSLIKNCSIFLTMDISTTILDALIFSKPVISISSKNYDLGTPKIFESNSCLLTDISSFEELFLEIQTNFQLKSKMINRGKQFIDDYLSFQGSSSQQLLEFLGNTKDIDENTEQVL